MAAKTVAHDVLGAQKRYWLDDGDRLNLFIASAYGVRAFIM